MDAPGHQQIFWKGSHAAHAATFFILLATGVLLFSATLRSRVVGGYSLSLRSIHCWTGVAFAVATLVLVPIAFRLAGKGSAQATGRAGRWLYHWRRSHLVLTVGAAAALTVSGWVLWQQGSFTLELMDASAAVHRWLTYVSAVVLAAHLSVAAIVSRAERADEGARRGGGRWSAKELDHAGEEG
jgi:cytochrome b subunit of formate dehydrogenase